MIDLFKLTVSRKNWAARGPARAFRARVCFGPGRFVLGAARDRPGPKAARPENGPRIFVPSRPGPKSPRAGPEGPARRPLLLKIGKRYGFRLRCRGFLSPNRGNGRSRNGRVWYGSVRYIYRFYRLSSRFPEKNKNGMVR